MIDITETELEQIESDALAVLATIAERCTANAARAAQLQAHTAELLCRMGEPNTHVTTRTGDPERRQREECGAPETWPVAACYGRHLCDCAMRRSVGTATQAFIKSGGNGIGVWRRLARHCRFCAAGPHPHGARQ